jgi:transcriptional regulator with XRE-family HTH domain
MNGQKLKEFRKAKGWTVFQLATASQIQPSLIFRYESGDIKSPTYANMRALADALGVTTDDLASSGGPEVVRA